MNVFPLLIFFLLIGKSFTQDQCYPSGGCTGIAVPADDARDCCVGTDDGQSYGVGPGNCVVPQCIVHGFVNATSYVVEGGTLDTLFQLNVKGMTAFSGLNFEGTITAAAGGSATISDFESVSPIEVSNMTEIRLFTHNDEITLEYNDNVILMFTPDNDTLIPGIEDVGEYVRSTTTVIINDNDRLEINFEESDYSIEEGGTLSTDIRLQFRNNQNPFTIRLCPIDIDAVEGMGLGFFIDSVNINNISRATIGLDFNDNCSTVIVPAATTSGTQTYTLPEFFVINDDNINEVEQSFAVVAKIGDDVPDDCYVKSVGLTECSCFQTQIGDTECFGRSGATEIRITDNDLMVIGFTERRRTVSESDVPVADSLQLLINVSTLRVSEREYRMLYRVLSSGTATVVSFNMVDFDARFGAIETEQLDVLLPGSDFISPLSVQIINDIVPEDEECFSIRISPINIPGLRELFMCDFVDNTIPLSIFCEHTICIEDDDEPFEVGFVETVYAVSEGAVVEVCVNLTQPKLDILDEFVVVEVVDYCSSVYVPTNTLLATPDEPNFLGQYPIAYRTDYAQQTFGVNAIDDETITELRRIVCYDQPIYQDLRLEGDEWLGLTLGVDRASVLTLTQPMYDQAAILILDNDVAVVGLEDVIYGGYEDEEEIQLCVKVFSPAIDCPIEFPFNVSLSTIDGIAVSSMDYVPLNQTVMFDMCETRSCVTVTIIDDFIVERNERFFFALYRTPGLHPNIDLDPVDGEVVILDDDDQIEVGYELTMYATSEDQEIVHLNIVIHKPNSGHAPRPFSLTVTTSDGTAVSPDDYEGVSGQIIEFKTGDSNQTHNIIIHQDQNCEGMEFFHSTITMNNGVEITGACTKITINDPAQCAPLCYTSSNCTGYVVPADDIRDCCVGTNEGQSYGLDSTYCQVPQCIVHGFVNATYNVVEGGRLDTLFQLNVKGMTAFFDLFVEGTITSEADGSANSLDIESFAPIPVANMANIRLFIRTDGITLEYNDSALLMFTTDNTALITDLEGEGEYIRDTAVVNIVDSDRLEINFQESDYAIEEGGTLSTDIRLQFRNNQSPFTIRLCPIDIDTAEDMGLGFFVDSGEIDIISRAISGADFSNSCVIVIVPAATTQGSQTYTLQKFFTVDDDDINEVEQSFALLAEIGDDVPDNCYVESEGRTECSCFQIQVGATECLGRSGATKIRITDNDLMVIGFTERRKTVSESLVPGVDEFTLQIDVATLRESERLHRMLYRVLSSGTAEVVSFAFFDNLDFDARFGAVQADAIEGENQLLPGRDIINPLQTAIRNDFVPEDEECYSIQISPIDIPGLRELFMCDFVDTSLNPPMSFFCEHTICIEDDDEPFEVGFVETVYTVFESVGSVEVCVNLTRPQINIFDEFVVVEVYDFPSSVYIPADVRLATPDVPNFLGLYLMAPMTDYAEQTVGVNAIDDETITELMRIVCYDQPIYEDMCLEGDEWLGLTLDVDRSSVLTTVRPLYDQAAILIQDNNRAVVGLESILFHVSEGVGVVLLCANISFPAIDCPIAFPFEVQLSTRDGSAVAPADFVSLNVSLRFAACETSRCVNVTILNDFIDEPDENFFYSLSRTPGLHPRIELTPADGEIIIVDDDSGSLCHTSIDCTGETVPADDGRDCCVGTNDGLSFYSGQSCISCIVHGFLNATYDVSESDALETLFIRNVKGETNIDALNISGTITASPSGNASESDFEDFPPLSATNGTVIHLGIIDDNIPLEYGESVNLSFTPHKNDFAALLAQGEYVRDTATVNIMDNDEMCVKDNCSPTSSTSQSAYILPVSISVPILFLIIVITATVVVIMCVKRKSKVYSTKQRSDDMFELRSKEVAPIENAYTVKETESGDLQQPQSISSTMTLIQQLQIELSKKHMLFQKHHVILGKIVGQGESGLVYRGYISHGGGDQLVAVKTVKALVSVADKERLLKEVSIMLSFSHSNVMPLVGLCIEGEMPLLIMPFMINGSVLEYVRKKREKLYFIEKTDSLEIEVGQKTSLGMCHQIAKGMSYLAKHKFVHRDLAARNCMIDGDGVIKVADFGLTEDMYGTNYHRHGRDKGGNEEKMPIRWMAPESIETDLYSESTDVWSFGVTCWEVFTCGGVPYAGVPALTLLRELHNGHRLEKPSNVTCSNEIYELMSSCWNAQPQKRPKFASIAEKFSELLDSDPSYLKLGDIIA